MTDKYVKRAIELMEREIAKTITKEEAFKSLQASGILDSRCEFTAPYRNLGRWIEECNKKKSSDVIEIKEEKL